jgi:anaerobic magnesium-protoporphyrin IX monomethyl ester cyclase
MLQTMFPMAITVMSAVLKQRGHEVDAFDTTFYETEERTSNEYRVERLQMKPFDTAEQRRPVKQNDQLIPDLRLKLESFQPDLIAVSALEDTFPLAVMMLRSIRSYGLLHLVGGVYPTFAPDVVLADSSVDMICVGEGEGALSDLCDALSNGRNFNCIPNLWVKQRDGSIVRNGIRPALRMDDLPIPDYSIFSDNRFYFPMTGKLLRIGSVETHRGCPYQCTFCNSPGQVTLYDQSGAGSFFRLKSPENVRREIRNLVDNYQVEYIRFPADTFLAMPDSYLQAFLEMYQDIGLPFWCQTRPETLTRERVSALEKMGCHDISIGIEHGNEDFRRRVVGRNYSNTVLYEAFRLLEASSMGVRSNNIVGLPTETRDLTWDTILLNRRISPALDSANAFHFAPYRGTKLRQMAIDLGYITESTVVVHNTKDTVLDMPQYSREEINGAIRTFNMYVRFPESEFPRIRRAESFDDRGNSLFDELRQEYICRFYDSEGEDVHAAGALDS